MGTDWDAAPDIDAKRTTVVRRHAVTSVRACAKIVRAHASALQLERRGRADLPAALDFSPIFADYNTWWRCGGAAPSASATAGRSRSDLEEELAAARVEGMDAARAMGAALFASQSTSVNKWEEEASADGAGDATDVNAALTFVTMCMTLRHARNQSPTEGQTTPAEGQTTPAAKVRLKPRQPLLLRRTVTVSCLPI